jgi:peptidoglycan hydrolase-like protein with peptidoglycan-binding domain
VGLAAWQVLAAPRVLAVLPAPAAFINDPSPAVILEIKGLGGLKEMRVSLNGDDVTGQANSTGDELTLDTPDLKDGEHTLSFSASSSNLLRRDVREEWSFTVDTVAPDLQLDGMIAQGQINTSPATFSGVTEPHATVSVTSGALKASGIAAGDGKYEFTVGLPDGPSSVTVSAADRAGNATTREMEVYVDSVPPTLVVAPLNKTVAKASVNVRIEASDQLGRPKVTALLDGVEQRLKKTEAGAVLKVGTLAQGRHVLVVSASDKGGNVVKDKQTFVVDSSERFGSAALWPGARGKDVKELQKRLTAAGLFTGSPNGSYDGRTEEAVKRYQTRYGLEADGRVDGTTLTVLGGRVVIDLGDLRLYLYRGDTLLKSYRIATGQSAYPTPVGSFVVVNKQMHPTWVPPPDSDWAKGAKPIPPGPGNPLGTRWIGISSPGVGIHGTSEPGSIGTYASHGCVRMLIPDVEDLYERIVVGMPVMIQP